MLCLFLFYSTVLCIWHSDNERKVIPIDTAQKTGLNLPCYKWTHITNTGNVLLRVCVVIDCKGACDTWDKFHALLGKYKS